MNCRFKIDQSLSTDQTYSTLLLTNTIQLTLNYYLFLENGNGIQVYQELVVFNNFVKFKSKSNFRFLVKSPRIKIIPFWGRLCFNFKATYNYLLFSFHQSQCVKLVQIGNSHWQWFWTKTERQFKSLNKSHCPLSGREHLWI